MKKPIRVFWSPLSKRFYASQHYKITNEVATITGEKFDVTDDIGFAIVENEITFSKDDPHGSTIPRH